MVEEEHEEDRAARGDTARTQAIVLLCDYAEDRNQNPSSFRQEDHGWQGGLDCSGVGEGG